MKQVAFSRETFSGFYADALPVLQRHNTAMSEEWPLRINEAAYFDAAGNDGLRIYTARDVETNQLAGYLVFLLMKEAHHQTFQAWADAFYIVPEYAGIGRALIGFAERELIGDQVEMINHEVRPTHPELAEVLKHLKYSPISTIFGKRVS